MGNIILKIIIFIASYICVNLFLKSFLERASYLQARADRQPHSNDTDADTIKEYYANVFSSMKIFTAHLVTIIIALGTLTK